MRRILYFIVHCTAGFGDVHSIERFWRLPANQGGAGWARSKGYNAIVDLQGKKHYLHDPIVNIGGYKDHAIARTWETVTNGVRGFNANAINISYIGGVDRNNVRVAKDTRTPEQKQAIIELLHEAYDFVGQYQDVSDIIIQGHRDFSPDLNGNGVIDAWERIKECPSFDAIPEYQHIALQYQK